MERENGIHSEPTSSPLFRTHKKRNNFGSNANQKKKQQKKNKDVDSEDSDYAPVPETSSAVQRIFTPREEISILESMIEFKKKNSSDPTPNMTNLLSNLKDSQAISHQITKRQLQDKIRRLRKKFNKHASGTILDHPLDSHSRTLIELSNKIWGEENDENLEEKIKTTLTESSRMVGPHYEEDRFEFTYPYLNRFLKRERMKIFFKKKLNKVSSLELKEYENDSKRISKLKKKANKCAANALEELYAKLLLCLESA